MSYSSSGAVATLWSPSNYSGTTKMPVPSTARRYSSTSGTSSYRPTGNTERPSYLSSTTGSSYTSSTRSIQTEYRSRYPSSIRSSPSVPTSYSRLTEIREASSRLTNKDRSEANESALLSYSRSKTDNDVTASLERCGLKTESYKLRTDSVSNRFLNTSKLDSKYSLSNRKFGGGTSLDLSRFGGSGGGSLKSTKITDLNTRLQRKDSLTKSESADPGPSPLRSLERRSSSSVAGGSSSPIEIRKSSEVWNKRLPGSYESAMKECLESDLFQKIEKESQGKLESAENGDDLSESSIILENIESEEKTLSFAEIRRKFDGNNARDAKGGYESSSAQKSSHSKDPKSAISIGVILDVHYQYLERNSKCKKLVECSVDDGGVETSDVDQLDTNNSFPSSQTLHGLLLKRIPGNLKTNCSNGTNNSSSNSNNKTPAYSNPRKSPDPVPDVSSNIKKRSLPDLKKAALSPEKKEGNLPTVVKLASLPISESPQESDPKAEEGGTREAKRETRKSLIASTLDVDNKNEAKIQPKRKGEKLVPKVEQTLSKSVEMEGLGTLTRLRRSPETKPKDFENETKVIELRRIEPFFISPFETGNKLKELESKEKKSVATGGQKQQMEKSPQRAGKVGEKQARTSPVKDVGSKDSETGASPVAGRKESSLAAVKTKKSASLKDEKETSNVRERELNKRLFSDEPLELKLTKKAEDRLEGDVPAKETPLMDKTEISKNYNNRTPPGPSAYHSPPSYSSNENLENAGIHGTSPRLGVRSYRNRGLEDGGLNGLHSLGSNESSGIYGTSPRLGLESSRNWGIEKGGLNGLKNIGNTCFMNSVIQCLSNTKPLLEYLLNKEYLADINMTISEMKGALIKAFSNVIQELWAPNAESKIVNTANFKNQIQRFAPRFTGHEQQDAQEFLRYLLEGLHEDVNRVIAKPTPITTDIDDTLSDNHKAAEAWKRYLRMDDSKVVDIFVGQLKSTLKCTVCGHYSVTFDPFWDLSLPLPNGTGQPRLSSCLDAFAKEEVLDGKEQPTCSKCNAKRKCIKSFSIQKFPKILVLHLKRFSSNGKYRRKLSVTVDFPLSNLDLSPYAANRDQAVTYNLYAVSNHSGTACSGHYTAYCKHPYTGNWHEYNDSGVSSLSSRSVISGEAYVLFYELAAQTSHL